MNIKVQEIQFQGMDLILVDGAIATKEAFAAGKVSFAHLYGDGNIRRFGNLIGTRDDILFGEHVEVEVDFAEAIGNMSTPEPFPVGDDMNEYRTPHGDAHPTSAEQHDSYLRRHPELAGELSEHQADLALSVELFLKSIPGVRP